MKSLPKEFLDSLVGLDNDAYRALPDVIASADPVVSVRINPFRVDFSPFPDTNRVEWCDNGFYLPTRPSFTLDPRLHQGVYYVQEASSMAIGVAVAEAVRLLEVEGRPFRYLDACAAPGGKTTAAIDMLPPDSFVVANEFDRRRAQILAENLSKWGADVFVTRGDASQMPLPKGFFDIIAADVPCSGEGMMRKDEYAIEQWSPALVAQCASRQRDIVAHLWEALRPGGFMIYSTCTFNLAENEEVVAMACRDFLAVPVELPLVFPGVLGAMGGYDFPAYRFVPGKIAGEGLFIAMLRKPDDAAETYRGSKSGRLKTKKMPPEMVGLLCGDYVLIDENPLRLIRSAHLPLYETMLRHLRPVIAGIEPGVMKGRDFIPSQSLALSRNFRRGFWPEVDVDEADALAYLRRQAIALPAGSPRGIVLLTFGGHPLGWVKNLGSRANNLYPEAWRIRN